MIVLTGASGHIGTNLVTALLARGKCVRVVEYVPNDGLEGLPVERVPGDVRSPQTLRDAMTGARTVIHLAGHISIGKHDAAQLGPVNVQGAHNVAQACVDAGVQRLVHFSSIHALTPFPLDQPVDENRGFTSHKHAPRYDRSKAKGEQAIQAIAAKTGLHVVTILPSGVIGPNDMRPSEMGRILVRLANGNLAGLVTNAGFNWVDVRDVVAGTLTAMETAPAGSRYLLAGERRDIVHIAEEIERLGFARAPRLRVGLQLVRRMAPFSAALVRTFGGRPQVTPDSIHALLHHQDVSTEKAQRELNYRPRPFAETLRDTLDWFVASGHVAPPRRAPLLLAQ